MSLFGSGRMLTLSRHIAELDEIVVEKTCVTNSVYAAGTRCGTITATKKYIAWILIWLMSSSSVLTWLSHQKYSLILTVRLESNLLWGRDTTQGLLKTSFLSSNLTSIDLLGLKLFLGLVMRGSFINDAEVIAKSHSPWRFFHCICSRLRSS